MNDMKASSLIVFYSCIFFVVGCDFQKGRTHLEKTTNEIKQGMSQAEISNLFKNFQSSDISDFIGELRNYGDSFHKGVAFETNAFVGFEVNYGPSNSGFLSPFEICTVYFNTNKIVMGYYYNLDH